MTGKYSLVSRRTLPVLAVIFACLLAGSCASDGANVPATAIVIVPALKGEIFPSENNGLRTGGISLISSTIKQQTAGYTSSYVFAANGTLVGSPEAFFSQGEDVVEALNKIGCDGLFLDARDFGFGRARLEELSRRAEFPFIAANIRDANGQSLSWIVPYIYDAATGLAVIGLAGPNVIKRNLEQHVAGLQLINEELAVRQALEALKPYSPKRIVVVAVGHKTTGDEATKLSSIAAMNEIDLVVQGDLDGAFAGLQSPTPRGKKIAWGVGILDGPADKAHNLSLIRLPDDPAPLSELRYKLLPVDSKVQQPDDDLRDFLYHIRSVTDNLLDDGIGETSDAITHDDNRESAFGDLIADLMRQFGETEIAVVNTGSLRDGFQKGRITAGALYRSLPFGGNMVIGKIRGSDLLAGLNRSVEYINHSELGRGMLQVSGLTFRWDPSKPAGSKVIASSVHIAGTVLDPNRDYSICTDIFVVTGGDGYKEFSKMKVLRTETQSTVNIMMRLLGTRQIWSPPPLDRFSPLGNG